MRPKGYTIGADPSGPWRALVQHGKPTVRFHAESCAHAPAEAPKTRLGGQSGPVRGVLTLALQ
jgi:hypothetical protein